MAIYGNRDIATDFYGDIILNGRGDLSLAESTDTYKSAANFLLRTDNGEYAPTPTVGCNLGTFIGKLNNIVNHELMEQQATIKLVANLFNREDIQVDVMSFDENEVLCVVTIGGYYIVDNEIVSYESEKLTYTFPYLESSNLIPFVLEDG